MPMVQQQQRRRQQQQRPSGGQPGEPNPRGYRPRPEPDRNEWDRPGMPSKQFGTPPPAPSRLEDQAEPQDQKQSFINKYQNQPGLKTAPRYRQPQRQPGGYGSRRSEHGLAMANDWNNYLDQTSHRLGVDRSAFEQELEGGGFYDTWTEKWDGDNAQRFGITPKGGGKYEDAMPQPYQRQWKPRGVNTRTEDYAQYRDWQRQQARQQAAQQAAPPVDPRSQYEQTPQAQALMAGGRVPQFGGRPSYPQPRPTGPGISPHVNEINAGWNQLGQTPPPQYDGSRYQNQAPVGVPGQGGPPWQPGQGPPPAGTNYIKAPGGGFMPMPPGYGSVPEMPGRPNQTPIDISKIQPGAKIPGLPTGQGGATWVPGPFGGGHWVRPPQPSGAIPMRARR